MKRAISFLAALLALASAFPFSVFADVYAPISVTRSADGTEIHRIYELSAEDNAAGLPVDGFEEDGFRYTFLDLIREEQPEYEEREQTETVTLTSEKNGLEYVLALLPQEKEAATEDGFSGTLAVLLDTVKVEPGEYGTRTWTPTATRSYASLSIQDANLLPQAVEDSGRTLTLKSVSWQADGMGGYTATATYSATARGSYVKNYVVTADYAGTVSRTTVSKVRYEVIFSGTPIPVETTEPAAEAEPSPNIPAETEEVTEEIHLPFTFNWLYVWILLGVLALAGAGMTVALLMKRRKETEYEDDEEETDP